ncbi:hypothetical protein THIOKS11100005 [Thiocapsa sp. KS1]|nr:hypothetical protein THIOKS11100005 [Thiocapsa sp. KS1]
MPLLRFLSSNLLPSLWARCPRRRHRKESEQHACSLRVIGFVGNRRLLGGEALSQALSAVGLGPSAARPNPLSLRAAVLVSSLMGHHYRCCFSVSITTLSAMLPCLLELDQSAHTPESSIALWREASNNTCNALISFSRATSK